VQSLNYSYNQSVTKAYIIRIPDHEMSMQKAERAAESCDLAGMDVGLLGRLRRGAEPYSAARAPRRCARDGQGDRPLHDPWRGGLCSEPHQPLAEVRAGRPAAGRAGARLR
jgi:hypothetical protein